MLSFLLSLKFRNSLVRSLLLQSSNLRYCIHRMSLAYIQRQFCFLSLRSWSHAPSTRPSPSLAPISFGGSTSRLYATQAKKKSTSSPVDDIIRAAEKAAGTKVSSDLRTTKRSVQPNQILYLAVNKYQSILSNHPFNSSWRFISDLVRAKFSSHLITALVEGTIDV